ncbi:MAG: efflux RND transporter periplasmic adaptor subunit [Desulfobulbaceae bacterium]|nr:MAG: efflux RND transporter periplasmic adaptor subunit [Desulfobulbaceae bacterium]
MTPIPPAPFHRRSFPIRCRHLFPLIAVTVLLLAGCSGGDQKGKNGPSGRKPATTVTTALCVARDVPVGIEATGRVEASASAEIRSQVGGILETVHFTEGAPVRRGEILFTIDPRPYQAQVKAREAALARNQAELANAEMELQRYRPAAGKGFVSQAQADQAATRVASLKATVRADDAALESARLDLQNCSLKAPFDGLAGEIASDAGNLVKANADSPLVTINRIAPVDVAFDIAGERLAEVRRAMAGKRLAVSAAIPGNGRMSVDGRLTFIDNGIDPATGTIRLKAEFANAGRELWPGQLTAVTLLLGSRKGALVIPSQAVQIGQDDSHVFVVRDDDTVEYRRVVTGIAAGGETVIEGGLAAGERVVTDGHLQLVDGGAIEDRGPKPEAGKTMEKPAAKEGGR